MTNRNDSDRGLPSCLRPARGLRETLRGVALCALAGAGLLAAFPGCNRTQSLEEIKAMQEAGRYEESIEPLRKRLESTPDDPETHLLYGAALSRTGAGRVAVWSLRKAAEAPEFELQANLELAGAQARVGNWKETIAAAETVLELEPENLTARILRGEAYINDGQKPEKAIEDFDHVIDEDPTNLQALTARAAALLMLNRVDEAAETIDQIDEVTAKGPGSESTAAQLCAVHAVLTQERGKLDEAEKMFDDCLEQYPSDASVVDAAITFFDGRGEPKRSDELLAKALELAPHSISYRRALALRKENAGESKQALEIFEAGLETDDQNLKVAVLTDLTNYHLDRDEIPEALAAWEKALELVDTPTQTAILSHADLLARAGRHEDARRVAKKLEKQEFGHLIEARIALDEGDPKRALEHLDQVFPSWPNNAGARYYAARAAEQLGDFARAVEEYRQSIRSAPEQTEAALRLAKLYRAGGALAECWSNAWQYATTYTDDPEGARTLISCATRDEKATLQGVFRQLWGSKLWPAAVATRLHALTEQKGPERGLEWLAEMLGPKADLTNPFFAELLREQTRVQLAAGRRADAEKSVAAAVAAHPEDGALLEIRAMLLESTDAAPDAVRAAFEEAVAKDAKSWLAIEGVARARERAGDLAGAIEAYDRSTKLHPESPEAARQAALLAAKAGAKPEEVEKRWLDLLKEHPWDGPAAAVYARLLLERGQSDARTLDYAERGVLFGGGKDAEKLLIAVHEARGEKERAAQVAKAFAEGKPIPPRRAGGSALSGAKAAAGQAKGAAQGAPGPAAPSRS
ncbi:MAG: tetratricopeptide repeat protein [Myxococcota bacterium]